MSPLVSYKEIDSVPKHKLLVQLFALRGQIPRHTGLFPDEVHNEHVTSVSSCQFPCSLCFTECLHLFSILVILFIISFFLEQKIKFKIRLHKTILSKTLS